MSGTTQQLASQARRAREAVARRDQLIRQAHAEGLPLRTIGDAAGLSHTAVAKIVARARTASL